jgi:hypothetical protein
VPRRCDWTGLCGRYGGIIPTMTTHSRRLRLPKATFYAVPVDADDQWRLLVHCPGSTLKYISGFNTKAEAEAWASGPEGNAWVDKHYRSKEQATQPPQ